MKKIYTNYFLTNNWKVTKSEKEIKKTFVFENFKSAFSWMTSIAIEAEKKDHHPEWKNIYKTIKVVLSTHDEGKITEKDLILAKAMDNEFKRYK